MTSDDLVRDYRAAFLRHLARRDEDSLAYGYALGRRALEGGAGLLDLVRAHHVVLAEVSGPREDPAATTEAAAELLTEVLASYEMARRTPESTF
ncbi:hypothetical protein JQN72_14165 [Phycicoccus sp. CSK15P-2]|uniref:phosphatase RsbU N-terminal domain-containing protein n=1 Tax=Phycicoccus sp. CSK15P-2 TaxID=2807627 RepID=UPI001950A6FF|nr:phosphatase RsbU N-terminal domain-containing protein [Phycicoccus sp. CSK15P-2]MBM6405387.1 hypothetical protein [Phycicoccus sp. CSK15P-2]